MGSKSTLAITSYIPGSPAWDPRWPASGPVGRETTLDTLAQPELIAVQDLPARHPDRLHFQENARWVVLEIAASDHRSQDGVVQFRRGTVLFNGPAKDACEFLRARGLPVPSSYGEVVDVRDWGTGRVGDRGIVLGGFDAMLEGADRALGHAVRGTVRVGSDGFALSTFGEVHAGKDGVAITTDGAAAQAGDGGLARTGEFGEASAGRLGVAIAETGGRATCGERGVALGLFGGSAIAGADGLAISRDDGEGKRVVVAGAGGVAVAIGMGARVQAGAGGLMVWIAHDGTRLRTRVAYPGEAGILPDTPYTLDDDGELVPA